MKNFLLSRLIFSVATMIVVTLTLQFTRDAGSGFDNGLITLNVLLALGFFIYYIIRIKFPPSFTSRIGLRIVIMWTGFFLFVSILQPDLFAQIGSFIFTIITSIIGWWLFVTFHEDGDDPRSNRSSTKNFSPTKRNVSGTLPKIKSKINIRKRKVEKKPSPPPTDQSVIFHYACPNCSAKLQPPTSPNAGQNCSSCGWDSHQI